MNSWKLTHQGYYIQCIIFTTNVMHLVPRQYCYTNTVCSSVSNTLEYTTVDDLLDKKNYTDLKIAARYRSIWSTLRRNCHNPAK